MDLSDGVTYTFDVWVSTNNQRDIPFYMVKVTWTEDNAEKSWTTSFKDSEISSSCSYISEYLTGNKASSTDVSKVSGLFYMISANAKRRLLNEASY